MQLLWPIIQEITLPLALLIAFGYLLERFIGIKPKPLGQLLLYAVLPASLMHFLTSAPLPLSAVANTAIFTVLQFFAFLAIGWIVARVCLLPKAMAPVVGLAMAFPNTGNYGIPLIDLAFGTEWVLYQTVFTSIHAILIILVGVPLLAPTEGRLGFNPVIAIKTCLKSPLILTVIVALLMKGFAIHPPTFLASSLEIMAGGLTPLALITLGVQISTISWSAELKPVIISTILALIAAPILTWFAAVAVGFDQPIIDLLTVGGAIPVGILLAILAAEQGRFGSFASAVAIVTTVLSPIAVTLTLLVLRS